MSNGFPSLTPLQKQAVEWHAEKSATEWRTAERAAGHSVTNEDWLNFKKAVKSSTLSALAGIGEIEKSYLAFLREPTVASQAIGNRASVERTLNAGMA
jgi:hypothetical protein